MCKRNEGKYNVKQNECVLMHKVALCPTASAVKQSIQT